MKKKMRKVLFTFTKEDKEIAYIIDAEAGTYKIVTRLLNDGDITEEIAVESGNLGNAEDREEIAKRIYYTLLTSMKYDKS